MLDNCTVQNDKSIVILIDKVINKISVFVLLYVKGERMDKSLLKLILILSAFLGVLFGVLTAIPYIGVFAFWILLCFASVLVIVFLMRVKVLELYTVNESAVIGGIIGFVSFMVFCIVYVPIVVILYKFFNYSVNPGVSLMLGSANIGIILILSVFMSVLSATLNAFTGFITYFLKEFLKTLDKNEEKRKNFLNKR